jgi:hypothetical protein
LIAVVGPLLKARKAIDQQTDDLDGNDRRSDRFKRSRSVGAYVGLTIRRHASCETKSATYGHASGGRIRGNAATRPVNAVS